MYTIGEFSNIAHVSARMLRYYDSLGLIHPTCIGDENGYRYYDAEQLSKIIEIQQLTSYGVRLKDIPMFLVESSQGKKQYLARKYSELLEVRKALDKKLNLINEEIKKMEGDKMNDYHVIVLDNPEQCVYGLKRKININEKEIQQLFKDLYTEINEKGIKRSGVAQLIYLGKEFSHKDMEVEAQVQVNTKTSLTHCIPACKCASVIHKGKHENMYLAYEAIGKWIAEHPEFHLAGPVIERFIKDDHDNEEFETGILFPIVKIKK